MTTPANALNVTSSGALQFDGAHTFSEISPATSGNLLMSNGAAWASTPLPNSMMFTAKIQVTSAQIKNLVAAPITVIAAPPANYMVCVYDAASYFSYGGTNPFTNGSNLTLAYATSNVSIGSNTLLGITVLTGTSSVTHVNTNGGGFNSALSNLTGNAVILRNIGGTDFTGNAAGDNFIDLYVSYTIILTV